MCICGLRDRSVGNTPTIQISLVAWETGAQNSWIGAHHQMV